MLHGKLLVLLLFGMVLFKQIHPNHINDSWLREGFIAVKRYQQYMDINLLSTRLKQGEDLICHPFII